MENEDRFAVKGVGEIKRNYKELAKIITDPEFMKKSQDTMKEAKILREKPGSFRVIYQENKAPFPVSNRDSVGVGKFVEDDKSILFAFCSPEAEYPHPVPKGVVRAHVYIQAHYFEKLDENTTRYTMLGDADPKGSIPMAVVNMMVGKKGAFPSNVLKFL